MDETTLQIGMTLAAEESVTESNTATMFGSGSLPVYATPAMCALMERAASSLAEKNLPAALTSVGTMLNIAHTSATPVGASVRAEATVTEIDGRKIVFAVKAFDEKGEIGSGTHERFVVNREKFLEKTQRKLQDQK